MYTLRAVIRTAPIILSVLIGDAVVNRTVVLPNSLSDRDERCANATLMAQKAGFRFTFGTYTMRSGAELVAPSDENVGEHPLERMEYTVLHAVLLVRGSILASIFVQRVDGLLPL